MVTMEPMVWLLLIGAAGGVIRSFLGFSFQADEGEAFNYGKMFQSLLRAAFGGTALVMGTSVIFNSPVTTATYVQALFLAIGTDVIVKETYGSVKGK